MDGEEREKVEGDGEGSMSGRRGWMEMKEEITWKGEGGRSAQIGVRRVGEGVFRLPYVHTSTETTRGYTTY